MSFVIPFYGRLNDMFSILAAIEGLKNSLGISLGIVLIDDLGNPPVLSMHEEISKIASKNIPVKVVTLRRNIGQQGASVIGLTEAEGQTLVLLDSDDCVFLESVGDHLAAFADSEDDFMMIEKSSTGGGAQRTAGSWLAHRLSAAAFGAAPNFPFSSRVIMTRRFIEGIQDELLAQNSINPGWMFSYTRAFSGCSVSAPSEIGSSVYRQSGLAKIFLKLVRETIHHNFSRVAKFIFSFSVAVFTIGLLTTVYYAVSPDVLPGYATQVFSTVTQLALLVVIVGLCAEILEFLMNRNSPSIKTAIKKISHWPATG